FIIKLQDYERNQLPYYRDYALALDKIHHCLVEKTGLALKMYLDEEGQEEMWNIIDDDLACGKVKLLAHVFDYVETGRITYEQNGLDQVFQAKLSLNNSIFFYEEYKVALVRVP